MRGRKALINRPDIKHPDHLELLDPVQRQVVRYRWGMETKTPLTRQETAWEMKTTLETVRRIEQDAAKIIIDYLQSTPRVEEETFTALAMIEKAVAEIAVLRDDFNALREDVSDHTVTLEAARRKRRWFRRLP
jgi:hypothetical protein